MIASKEKTLMAGEKRTGGLARRSLLKAGLAAGGAAAFGRSAVAGNSANQAPNIADWTRQLGEGVASRPYGKPSHFEAHVVKRDVEWLTASRESSVNFTPIH
ncbi:MAG TPA: sulfite dehydrogenase, partial [Alphaproteobacteria bacterium]|nr:sulfite dehydrogenase [Alphaproteobacteria bacterium]